MDKSQRTPFEEDVGRLTRQIRVLQVRLDKTQKGSPEHEALLRNLAAVSVLKAEAEVLLESAKERTLTEV